MSIWILTLNRTGARAARLGATATLVLAAAAAQAASGLQPPAADALWPHWQARISLQTGNVSPLALSGLADSAAQQRGVIGATLLGDYYFAPPGPGPGGFRASGGLLVGAPGGAFPTAALSQRWGWSLGSGGLQLPAGLKDGATTATYLGLGYSRGAWTGGWSLTADVGLVSERPAAAWGAARALFGVSGSDSSLREMRLSPLLQFGLRYTF